MQRRACRSAPDTSAKSSRGPSAPTVTGVEDASFSRMCKRSGISTGEQ